MEEKNKIRFIIWLFIVIIIILATVVGVLLYKIVNENGTKIIESTNNTNKTEIEENTNSKVGENLKNETATENVKTEIKEVIKEVEKYAFVKYDNSKVKDDSLSDLTDTYVQIGYPYDSAIVHQDGTVTVKYSLDSNTITSCLVENLNGKVVDVIGGTYIDGSSSKIYFLMEDGTVEVSDANRHLTKGIGSIGKIEGIHDIVRICYLNNNKAGVAVGIDEDGNCFSL